MPEHLSRIYLKVKFYDKKSKAFAFTKKLSSLTFYLTFAKNRKKDQESSSAGWYNIIKLRRWPAPGEPQGPICAN
jgi:hypothetical protein